MPLVQAAAACAGRCPRGRAAGVAGTPTQGFTLEPGGWALLDAPPATGARVAASFAFDVAVRFAEDRLSVSRATFGAGAAASVPLIEIREEGDA